LRQDIEKSESACNQQPQPATAPSASRLYAPFDRSAAQIAAFA
jgi:hypothetical protein